MYYRTTEGERTVRQTRRERIAGASVGSSMIGPNERDRGCDRKCPYSTFGNTTETILTLLCGESTFYQNKLRNWSNVWTCASSDTSCTVRVLVYTVSVADLRFRVSHGTRLTDHHEGL